MPDFGPLPEDFQTPCAVLDRTRLAANIARVADIAKAHGLRLRPHIKTHKSVDIARMQMDAGADGVTASRVDEALVFMRAGLPSVTVAYPVVGQGKLDALLDGAEDYGCEVRLLADSLEGVRALAAAGERHCRNLPVYLKIDVGLHRCGLAEDDPLLPEVAGAVHKALHLTLAGILSHAGHAYGAEEAAGAARVASDEAAIMGRVKALLEARGLPVPVVSVGSTPTVLAAGGFPGITEIRPGNYVFMDRAPVRLGLAREDEVALTVLATVISRNKDWIICDAGSKTLSSDGGPHGAQAADFGLAYALGPDLEPMGEPLYVRRLSEEHGWIERAGRDVPVGSRVRILPNHSCVVANLALAREGRLVFGG
ncbi:alanine racemase [Desulfocurvus sp. DL9XJH121]